MSIGGPTAPAPGDGGARHQRSFVTATRWVRPGSRGPADRLPADLADGRHRLRDGRPADPLDDLARVPAGPAAQPAPARASSATTAWRTSATCWVRRGSSTRWSPRSSTPSRAPRAPSAWACSPRSRCGSRSAAAAWCGRACSCRTSPRSSPRPSCGRRCSTPSSGSPTTTAATLLGWDEPIAFLSSSEAGLDPRLRHPRQHRARERRAVRGVAVVPVRLPLPHRADAGDPREPRGGRHWSTGRRRPSGSGTSSCRSCCPPSPC